MDSLQFCPWDTAQRKRGKECEVPKDLWRYGEIWDSPGGHWERSMGYPDISTSLSSAAQPETDQITLVHLLVLQVQLSLRSLMWRRPSFAKMSDSIRLNLWHGLVDEYMLHTMPPCPILFQTDWDIRSIWNIATSETLSLWNMPMEMLLGCDRAVAIRCARPFQDHESRSLKCLRGPKTTKTAKLKRSTWQQISDIIFLVMNTEYTYHISLENLDLIPDSLCRIICFVRVSMLFPGLPEATHLQWQLRWPLGGRRFSTAAQNLRPGLSEDM